MTEIQEKKDILFLKQTPNRVYAQAEESLKRSSGLKWHHFSQKGFELSTDVFYPSHFDPKKKYPVIDVFGEERKYDAFLQSLAELGFIVFFTNDRNKKTPPAQFVKMRMEKLLSLGRLKSYIDLNQVGLMGMGEGALKAIYGSVTFPKIYQVTVAFLSELPIEKIKKYQGLLHFHALLEGHSPESQKQKLLLIHQSAIPKELMNTLIKIDIDFDLFISEEKEFSNNPFFIKKIWDYFVSHLQGEKPPEHFRLATLKHI